MNAPQALRRECRLDVRQGRPSTRLTGRCKWGPYAYVMLDPTGCGVPLWLWALGTPFLHKSPCLTRNRCPAVTNLAKSLKRSNGLSQFDAFAAEFLEKCGNGDGLLFHYLNSDYPI